MRLGAIYAGATVAAWYPITPSTSVVDAFTKYAAKYRVDPETGKNNYAIVQAEDELGRDRHGDGRLVERRSCLYRDERPGRFA